VSSQDTVLIVEDEENLRELLRMVLEESGIKVLEAGDGVEALEIFTTHKDEIGVVLSDLGLPRLGGWEAFLKMRKINPEVKGILASGFFNADVRTEIIKSGAIDFIEKPYISTHIVRMILDVLGDTNKIENS
jgi:two-component system, cell cycle sensor histidine kinase and response regulator CckA